MNVPRCAACDRIAVVEIDAGIFLCKRCETILKREFPNFRAGAKPAEEAAADAEPAPCIAAANQSCGGVESRHASVTRDVGRMAKAQRDTSIGPQAGVAPGPQDTFPDIPKFLRRP